MSHERCTSGGSVPRRFGSVRFDSSVRKLATRERRSVNDDGFDDDFARALDVVSDDGRARGERERGR